MSSTFMAGLSRLRRRTQAMLPAVVFRPAPVFTFTPTESRLIYRQASLAFENALSQGLEKPLLGQADACWRGAPCLLVEVTQHSLPELERMQDLLSTHLLHDLPPSLDWRVIHADGYLCAIEHSQGDDIETAVAIIRGLWPRFKCFVGILQLTMSPTNTFAAA